MEPFISLMLAATLVGSIAACTPQYDLSPRVYLDTEHPDSMESCWENWNESEKDYLISLCDEYDLDYTIMAGVIYNESNFKPDAVGENSNGTRDWGYGQINDVCYTFVSQYVAIDEMSDLLNPYLNMEAMCVLMDYHKDATGDDKLALLRYQVGEGNYARMVKQGKRSSATQVQVLKFAQKIPKFDENLQK